MACIQSVMNVVCIYSDSRNRKKDREERGKKGQLMFRQANHIFFHIISGPTYYRLSLTQVSQLSTVALEF